MWHNLIHCAATEMAEENDIESDAKYINQLVLSAKNGDWATVWEILGSPEQPIRQRLLNVIPENRRWGVLHQAVYWNNRDILHQLLKYDACDSKIKAKQCTSECGPTSGMDACQIAEAYNYTTLAGVLRQHESKIHQQSMPTLLPAEGYTQSKGLCLITTTLAAYKQTFHPKPIDRNKSIITILGDVFNGIMKSDQRWKEVKEKVCDTVYVICEKNYKTIKKSTTREEFFKAVIKTYTVEKNEMYKFLNKTFRRQNMKEYRPTGDDLALGPYAAMYQMMLLFWHELPRERRTTYRKMMLNNEDISEYHIGKCFVWSAITSSSSVLNCAIPFPTFGPGGENSVVFIIDNSADSFWQPRNIEKYSNHQEHERTYPAGAKFMVTGRTNGESDLQVSLKLLP